MLLQLTHPSYATLKRYLTHHVHHTITPTLSPITGACDVINVCPYISNSLTFKKNKPSPGINMC